MNDITQTAIQDCQAKKRELAAEVVSLREQLLKEVEANARWAKACSDVHDARILADAEVIRLRSMTLWEFLRAWWDDGCRW